jgi:basic membrane protein A and related proteins
MDFGRISRRHLLQGSAALTLGTALGARSALAADTTIGFIYVGSRDDYGYNQAHAQGAAALKKMPGLKIIEEEKVAETDAVEKTMESMINLDGATLLFPTSFGYYNPHMIKMASKFPKLRFEHCGGLWSDKDPKNAGSYFGYIDEAQYISGIVAGYSTKTNKLGFVAAKPIPQVLRNINAFTLGAKLANPKATTQVIFTGDWSMPVKEAEATNSLIDQGVDVLTCHVDGPKTMVENAARREVAAVQGRTNANLAAGYGFTGILVAFLARQNPLAIIPVAVLLGGISASGGLLQRRLGLPDASVQVLQGIIFVFVLASDALYGRLGFLRGRS